MKHRIYWGLIEPDPDDVSAARIRIDLAADPANDDESPLLDDWLVEQGAMLVQLFEGTRQLTRLPTARSCHLLIDLEPEG